MTVKVTTSADIANRACPDRNSPLVAAFNFRKLLSGDGDRSSALVVEVQSPGNIFPMVKLDALTVRVDESFFNSSCRIGLRRFDYATPIFSMAGHANQTMRAGLHVYRKKSFGGVFANTIDQVLGAAGKFAGVPAKTVALVNGASDVLRETGTIDDDALDEAQFLLASSTDRKGTFQWRIKKFDSSLSDDIVITASLQTLDHLFDPSGGIWNAANVLSRSYYSPTAGSAQNVGGFLLAAAGTEYSSFNSATDVNVAAGACTSLFGKVDQMGLTARDAAVLKWALVRAHPNLGGDARMDRIPCMNGVFDQLPKTVASNGQVTPAAFVIRELPVVEIKRRKPNFAEMSSTLEAGQALALFFKYSAWSDREPLGQQLFAKPHNYLEKQGLSLLTTAERQMEAPSSWPAYQWDINRPLAKNVGCYSYRKSATDIPEDQVYAIGNFATGQGGAEREALIRITFDSVPVDGSTPALIKSIEFDPKPASELVAAVKLRNGTTCGGGWSPTLLR